MLACLILNNAYSGLFYSLLALPKREPPIDTVEQFLAYITVNRRVELVRSAYTNVLLLKASPENELFYRIGQRFNR